MNAIKPFWPLAKIANSIARKSGHGRATAIVFGLTDGAQEHVRFGYRKHSTGEYVSNAYRKNFGWKNTYYQNAETTVRIAVNPIDFKISPTCATKPLRDAIEFANHEGEQ